MKLGWGLSNAVPETVTTAWGARLIAPNDLLHDRQDLVAASPSDKDALVGWLNSGAIKSALDNLWRDRPDLVYRDGGQFTAYEDERGIIVGNTNNSGGYVYVAAWLKERE